MNLCPVTRNLVHTFSSLLIYQLTVTSCKMCIRRGLLKISKQNMNFIVFSSSVLKIVYRAFVLYPEDMNLTEADRDWHIKSLRSSIFKSPFEVTYYTFINSVLTLQVFHFSNYFVWSLKHVIFNLHS